MVSIFNGKIVPKDCGLVGYTWLISHFDLNLPTRKISCISQKRLSTPREVRKEWTVFDSQLSYEDSIGGHVEFSLKHEQLDLLLLKRVLDSWDSNDAKKFIESNLKGIYNRKIWFYYEFFSGIQLELQDISTGKYEDLLNRKDYFVNSNIQKSKRHKINNNLLGTASFCPIIKKTEKLVHLIDQKLSDNSKKIVGKVSSVILRRAASFLLLADSKASFEIEGERPPKGRIERWGKIINDAGNNMLSLPEIERLHAALIHNTKNLKIGLRDDGVFLGDRDREGDPIPEFIGAKESDLKKLLEDWLELNKVLGESDIEPVIYAAIMAFSFVYIHPLEDGNGRIHRYLFHHILGKEEFYPKGMIFPISSVILDNIDIYRDVLVSHSGPLMDCIEWDVTDKKNVFVTNDTADFYRYFDATRASEFVFECARKTIDDFLPREIKYLERFDKSYEEARDVVEMADHELKQLLTFIIQNEGKLSARKKEKFFEKMPEDLLSEIEEIIRIHFELDSDGVGTKSDYIQK